MIEYLSISQIVTGVFVNVIALISRFMLKSAPPRLQLYVCVFGMAALLMPWSIISTQTDSLMHETIARSTNFDGVIAASTTLLEAPLIEFFIVVWFSVSAIWLLASIARFIFLRKSWRVDEKHARI